MRIRFWCRLIHTCQTINRIRDPCGNYQAHLGRRWPLGVLMGTLRIFVAHMDRKSVPRGPKYMNISIFAGIGHICKADVRELAHLGLKLVSHWQKCFYSPHRCKTGHTRAEVYEYAHSKQKWVSQGLIY